MKKLSNITLIQLRKVFIALGLSKVRVKGGHEIWAKERMIHPIIIQTHITPVPERIVKNCIDNLNITKSEFLSILDNL